MARRVVDLTDGVAMVVTDLHGHGEAFEAYRARFEAHFEAGEVQRLILCGDLIHGYGPANKDRSLEMVQAVMALQAKYGPENVIMLLGNHELPHLYSLPLSRGSIEYTPRFEAKLAEAGADVRAQVIDFISGLPFVVRTAAGVMINHTGAAALAALPGNRDRLQDFSHKDLVDRVDRVIMSQNPADLQAMYSESTGMDYGEAVRYYLAVESSDDPRYNDLLRAMILNRSDSSFELLWDTFFTRNEFGSNEETYGRMLDAYLQTWSAGAPAPQRVLVAGHIPVNGGYQIVAEQQLRLASRVHANPPEAGLYLLLDCARPVEKAEALIGALRSVFAA